MNFEKINSTLIGELKEGSKGASLFKHDDLSGLIKALEDIKGNRVTVNLYISPNNPQGFPCGGKRTRTGSEKYTGEIIGVDNLSGNVVGITLKGAKAIEQHHIPVNSKYCRINLITY